MNMLKYKNIIEEGDLVLVYLNVRNLYPLTMKRDNVFQSKYGALKHNDVIGKKFGSVIHCTLGYVYVLFPTPELWTLALPHRTQILYAADISMIILQLDLKPGSIVCEAGTGSGSLSHALARAIAPNGILYTYDFHEKRVEAAQKEFEMHGLTKIINIYHKDVSSDGFSVDHVADAVFLDLPQPWDVIPFVPNALKLTGGRICTFSPCIEQVQRTCLALQENSFRDIVTVECLQRQLEVKKIPQQLNTLEESDNKNDPFDNQDQINESCSSKKKFKKDFSLKNAESSKNWEAVSPFQTPGHTGYLTYASLFCKQT